MNALTHTASGETLLEAFNNLGIDYLRIKTKGEITVTKGERKAIRLIQLPKLRRYFLSKLLMSGLIRDFEKLLA
jgi:hypothetical protein